MKKETTIDGKAVTIEANALLPRQYRKEFGRDLIADMRKLADGYRKDPDSINTEVLENITWLMLRAGGTEVPESVEEWLEGLDDAFAVYGAINDVIDVWIGSQKTTSKPKKKLGRQRAK